MRFPADISAVLRYLVLGASFFIIVIGMKMTAYVGTILVISLILTMLALPALHAMKKRGIPDIAAVSLLTVVACLFILVLFVMMFSSFYFLIKDLPLYQQELNQRIAGIIGFLGNHGISTGSFFASSIDLSAIVGTILSSAMNIGELLLYLFFIGVTTFFMLLEAPRIPMRIVRIFGSQSERVMQFSRMSRYLIDFVIVRTETNFVHGLLFGGFLFIMGIHGAVLWGILTFILSYIPYIGLIIAAIPAIFFAWLQFGTWGVIAVIAAVCILNLVVENVVFTHFASRKFDLPAVIVIISVIFWEFVLGLAGMVFAVPITLMVLILFQCSDDFRWINVLLGVDRFFEEGSPGPDTTPPL